MPLTPEQQALKQAAIQFKVHGMFTTSHGRFNELANVDVILDLLAKLEAAQPIHAAVARLIKGKGRYHTEQNYADLVAAFNGAPVVEAVQEVPVTDKLLAIIASAYQIAGAHDAPAHILDVLADPEAATDAQVEAMLPYQPGRDVPDGLAESARAVVAHLSREFGANGGPNHCHSVPGVWDISNRKEIAGKPCEWCAAWARFKALAAVGAMPGEPAQ